MVDPEPISKENTRVTKSDILAGLAALRCKCHGVALEVCPDDIMADIMDEEFDFEL